MRRHMAKHNHSLLKIMLNAKMKLLHPFHQKNYTNQINNITHIYSSSSFCEPEAEPCVNSDFSNFFDDDTPFSIPLLILDGSFAIEIPLLKFFRSSSVN